MRVIAGEAKGRTLVVPRGGGTRSATDRIRETLFAIVEPELDGARVLDLFAGAGTLGIEALSRGAARATFMAAYLNIVPLQDTLDGSFWGSKLRANRVHGVPGQIGCDDLVLLLVRKAASIRH